MHQPDQESAGRTAVADVEMVRPVAQRSAEAPAQPAIVAARLEPEEEIACTPSFLCCLLRALGAWSC